MGVVASNVCNFCKTEKDSIYHYLWQCEHTRTFWNELENCLKSKCCNCDRLKLSTSLIVFGYDENIKTDEGFDFILLRAKIVIYKCRIINVKPLLQIFLKELAYIYKIDQYVHAIKMQQFKCIVKWASYKAILEN